MSPLEQKHGFSTTVLELIEVVVDSIKSSTIPAKNALFCCIIMSIRDYFGIGLLVCGSKDIISLPNSDGSRLDRSPFCSLAICFGLVGMVSLALSLVPLVPVGLVVLALLLSYPLIVGLAVLAHPLSYLVPVGLAVLALPLSYLIYVS